MVTVNLVQAKAHPLEILRVAGVLVFAGNDDIRDTWSPYCAGRCVDARVKPGQARA